MRKNKNKIQIGDTFYERCFGEFYKVEVVNIYVEYFLKGAKTIFVIKNECGVLSTKFLGDFGCNLFDTIEQGKERLKREDMMFNEAMAKMEAE